MSMGDGALPAEDDGAQAEMVSSPTDTNSEERRLE